MAGVWWHNTRYIQIKRAIVLEISHCIAFGKHAVCKRQLGVVYKCITITRVGISRKIILLHGYIPSGKDRCEKVDLWRHICRILFVMHSNNYLLIFNSTLCWVVWLQDNINSLYFPLAMAWPTMIGGLHSSLCVCLLPPLLLSRVNVRIHGTSL